MLLPTEEQNVTKSLLDVSNLPLLNLSTELSFSSSSYSPATTSSTSSLLLILLFLLLILFPVLLIIF